MLKIWGRTNSSNVQKVMWCVGELGLAHERHDAGREFGVVNDPDYRAKNPNGRVPTIEDQGVVLWESNAICRHLARRHGRLMPAALADQARVDMWMDWQQTEAMAALTPVFWGLVRTAPEKRDHAAIAEGKVKSIAAMTIMDAELGRHSHVVGNTFTVADIPMGVVAFRYFALVTDSPRLAHLERWYRLMLERPAFRTHVADVPLT
jgi:glutathione S-transferase